MDVIREELTAGLPDAEQMLRIAVRLVMAMVLGAVLGFERERIGKPAGLRTHMLVAVGSALFVLVPSQAGSGLADTTRVIQGIATGIGFIGTGAIIKRTDLNDVQGLTTAAGIWLTAAVGVAAGLGRLGPAILSVVLAWIILAVFGRITEHLEEAHLNKAQAQANGSDRQNGTITTDE